MKLLYVKCDKLVCVCEERRREAVEKEPGIQNQKQEPHTKLWGKRDLNARQLPCMTRGFSRQNP